MFIGSYLCIGAVFLAIGYVVVSRWKGITTDGSFVVRRYLFLAIIVQLTSLVLFFISSLASGLMELGGAGSWNYPQDYLKDGPIAWLIMLLPLLGILSPLILALIPPRWLIADRPSSQET